MFDADVVVTNQQIIADYATMAAHAFDYMAEVIAMAAQPVADEMLPYLQREPGPVALPVEWTSERQRRWYFATHKGRIPYRRTHGLSKGYSIQWIKGADIATLEVQNPATAWTYVKGPDMQRFHFNTQWDSDIATFAWYSQKFMDVIYPAVVNAWMPANVSKAARKYA